MSCCDKIKQKKQLLKFLSFHFAGSPKWRERQVYILTVEKLILHKAIKVELFNNYVLKKLLELSVEKIPNIRLCVARLLKGPVMETRKCFIFLQTALSNEFPCSLLQLWLPRVY